MLVVLSCLAVLGAYARIIPAVGKNRTVSDDVYWRMWKDFKRDNQKTYLTSTEHNDRFEVFKDNVDKINRHNVERHSWTMGVTPFADLTAEEFAKTVGGCTLKERVTQEREVWMDTSNNPDAIDWTTKNMVTEVKNQGQCGSCWAFSTTGSVESRSAIATGTLNSLSEQELVDCSKSPDQGCEGGLMDYGFEYVQGAGGLCSETGFPYTAKDGQEQCESGKAACGGHIDPISGYKDVPPKNAAQLEAAIAEGPVSIAIQANQQAFQLYSGGVLDARCGARLDHGVLAVGYGVDDNGVKFWKVKNSWGAKWGVDGYILLCRDCGKNFGKGQCGILGQPSYPIV